MILKERDVSPEDIKFGTTTEGKPYIVNQPSNPPIAYNISHDNHLIAMAIAPGLHRPPAFSVGIDVMKLRVPGRETFRSFVDAVGDQVSTEFSILFSTTFQKPVTVDRSRASLAEWRDTRI
jgi:4'-phosphopantetheinyl transferase